ncbi:MAG: hypothetical protein AAB911_02470 [Patescibacteria group bacterium]
MKTGTPFFSAICQFPKKQSYLVQDIGGLLGPKLDSIPKVFEGSFFLYAFNPTAEHLADLV